MNQDIKHLVLAAKYFVIEQNGKEIDEEACRQAACALAWVFSEEAHTLPEGWYTKAKEHGKVLLSNSLKELIRKSEGKNDMLKALGLELILPKETHDDDTMQSWLQKVTKVKGHLKDTVIGQGDAIEAVCDGLAKQVYRSEEASPAGLFLFVGTTATGKTLLAQTLATALGDDWTHTSVQMDTMTSSKDGFQVFGLAEGYTDAKPGKITEFVRENPKSVVVFENFNRAHANVQNSLMDVLNRGVMVDQYYDSTDSPDEEPEVSFQQAIVIFTSNSDTDLYESPEFHSLIQKHPEQLQSIVLNALGQPEKQGQEVKSKETVSLPLLNSLTSGSTVFFRRLDLESLTECAERSLEKGISRIEQGLQLQVTCKAQPDIARAMVMSFAPEVNALRVNNSLLERLFDPILDCLQQNDVPISKVQIRFAHGQQKRLKEILEGFRGKDVVREMFRKNNTLSLTLKEKVSDECFVLEIGGLAIERVSHAHDFGGAGAIRTEVPQVSFNQIAGHNQVKQRLLEIVALLKDSEAVKRLGVDVPKGLLLWGEPGTGKTLLAKALAHEADLPFISTTGSELLDLNLMKSIFKRARKYAPSILFIDEIDAIGSRDNTVKDIIINQLLTEVDGFDTGLSAPVFIIAATNLPDKIDLALIRSGRIDLKVEVPMLDRDARAYFIDEYFKLPHDGSLDRDTLLNYTAGMSGADLEKVKRETVLEMVSSGQDKVSMDMLLEQVNIKKYGVRSVNKKLLKSLEPTAYHEAGHAIVSRVVNPDILIEQVTVVPRERALGFVSFNAESFEHRQYNRQETLDMMAVALAGRLAQSRQFPEWGDDSGASSDIKSATNLAIRAITEFGLDEEVGCMLLSVGELIPSPGNNQLVFERVQVWLKEAEEHCRKVLDEHWDDIDKLAKRLIKEETVIGKHIMEMEGSKAV